ncbi:hypothetical protein J3458_001727 [Metarhizium acridum]|uniref:uncharacterized protein n=1 Tax=Metarhizium acridum TaxID=92637 RepID=UPI001C6BE83A|nr:hypothetical protein J3458_001727 [Metarhizium acridum]
MGSERSSGKYIMIQARFAAKYGPNHESNIQQTQTDAFQTMMDRVFGNHTASTICLTNGDFENQDRNNNEEDTHIVWYEPLQAVVVEDLRRIQKKITNTSASARCREKESSPRGPLVPAVG